MKLFLFQVIKKIILIFQVLEEYYIQPKILANFNISV